MIDIALDTQLDLKIDFSTYFLTKKKIKKFGFEGGVSANLNVKAEKNKKPNQN